MYFLFFAVILAIGYNVLLTIILVGWRKALQKPLPDEMDTQHSISVVVPVRDERSTIGTLLQQLQQSIYSSYEVIIVDDHSSDGTFEYVKQWIAGRANFRCIASSGEGKKAALTAGIAMSDSDIIVTTDGDCEVHAYWLKRINACFQSKSVMFAFGGVAIQSDGKLWSDVQAIEFASLIGSGAALWAHGYPVMCNGANLAFRKHAFERVNGYVGNIDIASGDDEFLMRKIVREFPKSIVFVPEEDAVVKTTPKSSIGAFLLQRFRWAGKWKHNDSVAAKLVAVYVFAVQLALLSMLILLCTRTEVRIMVSIALLSRAIAEAIVLRFVCRFLSVRWRWGAFILLQVFYPLYVVVTGMFSNFITVTWKKRKIV
ncbi:glycosyltransferase [Pseudochryseolinea flava]|uniref:Glycosyltransferase 2-like domain-containing protein n=1 Tax=Pseudochryseolinea flava TaxID=2059302 RepID=A0A364Y4C0_9BACT|nr:glycosyltransferase [Pseudochryseolinea flava]RAW01616.1 hypothetical protein DQQ10_08135 [Pseudochryseolinea flava]